MEARQRGDGGMKGWGRGREVKEGKLRRKEEGERGESESVCMSECKLECCVQPQLACDVVVRGVTHPWVGRWSSGPPHNLAGLGENDSIRRSTSTA